MIVDWTKYKRFFTFGCSFTSYMWPTWADIVSKEMPNVEFYNFGYSGSGNTLISYRIAEVNNRYKFTDTDLIMVMFTTYCREDRWIDIDQAKNINLGRGWLAIGNIFNNNYYPDSWIRNFANERGYLIRDAAVIDMTVNYLESLASTSYCMLSFPFTMGSGSTYDTQSLPPTDIYEVYEELFTKFKPSLFELELQSNHGVLEYDYQFSDGHPSPIRYYNYIKKLGFNLTEKSEIYAKETSEILKSIGHRNIVPQYFPEQDNNVSKSHTLLF